MLGKPATSITQTAEFTWSTEEGQAKEHLVTGSWKGHEDDQVCLDTAGEDSSGQGKLERQH